MLSDLEVMQDVGERLDKAGIEYMLTGSAAMNFYVKPRKTRSIDMVAAFNPLRDAAKLQQQFEPDYYIQYEERAVQMVRFESVVNVNISVLKDDDYERVEFARRRPIELSGFRAWVTAKEGVILSKLVSARNSVWGWQLRDARGLFASMLAYVVLFAFSRKELRDVRNMLASGADEEYLHEWAERLGVASLLEKYLHT